MHIPDLSAFNSFIKHREVLQIKERPDLFHFKLKLTFIDGSLLHVRENHIPVLSWHEYSYQWLTASHEFICRWDNAHERYLTNVPPHHQHIGSEENVLPSEPMTLEKVLSFIAQRIDVL